MCVCVCVCDRESEEGVVVQSVALPFTQSSTCMYFSPLPEILPLAPKILTLTISRFDISVVYKSQSKKV